MTTIVPTDHNVEVNGLNIHYLDWGGPSNRNLLFVHGQGGNAHNWDHIARELHQRVPRHRDRPARARRLVPYLGGLWCG